MYVQLAGFVIEFRNQNDKAYNYFLNAGHLLPDSDNVSLTIDMELIDKLKSEMQNYAGQKSPMVQHEIAEWLPLHNAFLMHGATFDYDGTGVIFTAHSGTGKTTHMLLWQQLLGDKMTVVNGDKPIVRFFEDEPETPYAYGTPWCGKEQLGCNMRTPLKHICFIERSDKNSCEPMEKADAVNLIFNQVYMPKDPAAMMNTIQLIDRLLSCCKLWKIRCNMEPDAAETSFNAIFGMRNIDKPTATV